MNEGNLRDITRGTKPRESTERQFLPSRRSELAGISPVGWVRNNLRDNGDKAAEELRPREILKPDVSHGTKPRMTRLRAILVFPLSNCKPMLRRQFG
ncbi:hypothetical protein QYF36_011998 [Acer negundo]|nr:hypothetical protein QYF36_011998 [Acer negundo]